MNSFQTRSNPQKYMLTVILTFIPLFALAFLGLKVAVITWLFFEGILALCFCFCLFLVVRSYWEIEIKDNCIYLYNTGNRQSFYVDELTRSDLIIKQNDTQKRKNLCRKDKGFFLLSQQYIKNQHQTKACNQRICCTSFTAVRVSFGYHFIAYYIQHRTACKGKCKGQNCR